jgi:hypothetical protein
VVCDLPIILTNLDEGKDGAVPEGSVGVAQRYAFRRKCLADASHFTMGDEAYAPKLVALCPAFVKIFFALCGRSLVTKI